MVDKYRRIEVPDIQVTHKGFTDNNNILLAITDVPQLTAKFGNIPGIKEYNAENLLTGMISTAKAGIGIKIYGVDIDGPQFFELSKAIPDSLGTYLSKAGKDEIIIGKALAKKLNARLKSKVVLTFQTLGGELVGGAFRVVGIFDTQSSIDEANVYINNNDLIDLAQIDSNSYHLINVRVTDESLLNNVKTEISGILGDGYDVSTWRELRPELSMMNEMMEMMSFLILTIILIALGFSVVNTMLMVVLERTKELGMLLAVGMSKVRVYSMITLETLMLTSFGGVIGIVCSVLVIQLFSHTGLNIRFDDVTSIPGIDDVIYPQLLLSDYITTGMMVFFTGFIASIFPSRRILKMNPADIVRN